jgi:hypothetical protein
MAKLSEPEAGARLAEEATGRLSEPETAGARLSEPEGNVAKGGGGERAGSATKDSDSEGAGGATEPGH